MNTFLIVGLSIVGLVLILAIAFVLLRPGELNSNQLRSLLGGDENAFEQALSTKEKMAQEEYIESIKKASGNSQAKSEQEDLSALLFKAGYFSSEAKTRFRLLSIIAMVVMPVLLFAFAMFMLKDFKLGIVFALLGLVVGYSLPSSFLQRVITRRQEDLMYYLPLVIEQISIGVSSALDIGPCIAMVVETSTERDSHNPVTEMFVHVEKLIRSGLNLEDALVEVGQLSGMNEIKHAFMFLSQCARHGGELSKQLQELADAVMVQKQVRVEDRIARLPVKATGPLGMVFIGFLMLLLAGLFTRLKVALTAMQ